MTAIYFVGLLFPIFVGGKISKKILLAMKMKQLCLLLFIFLLSAKHSNGQYQVPDIVKLTYYSAFGGMFSASSQILLEIKPDGAIRMYNNTLYDSAGSKQMNDLIEGGSRTISVQDLSKMTVGDSLASYFIGKITKAEYKNLTDLIMQIPVGTTNRDYNCCCDIPYSVVRIYFKNGKKRTFMNCDTDKNFPVLMNFISHIANRQGYTKPSAKLNLDGIY